MYLTRVALIAAAAAFTGTVNANAQGVAAGAVFVATNSATGNSIIMYDREPNGELHELGHFATGGRGQGGINDPLESQYSIVLTADHQFLLAVNAGTSDISVFRVKSERLELVSVTPSGGGNPISLGVHGDLVYVLNAGSTVHTAGFRLKASGRLAPIPNSQKTLSDLDVGPSTVVISPDGAKLVISERDNKTVDVFTIEHDGSLANPVFNAVTGVWPFGMTFTPSGRLLVTFANAPSLDYSYTSSYTINPDNTLSVITDQATANGGRSCWIATNGTYAWVSNTTTSTIGYYSLTKDGALDPLGIAAIVPATNPVIFPPIPATSFPIDMALTSNGKYLYDFFSVNGQLAGFRVNSDGSLTQIGSVFPEARQTGANGLAAY